MRATGDVEPTQQLEHAQLANRVRDTRGVEWWPRTLVRRRWRAVSVALALAIAFQLTVGVFVVTQQRVITPVTLERALEKFRASGPDRPTETSSPTAPAAAVAAAATGAPVTTTPTARPAGSRSGASQASTRTASPRPTPGAPYTPPPEGVYAYRTTGSESISVGGASHSYPDETYGIVRHLGGCRWDHESQIIEEHRERRTVCTEPGRLSMLYAERHITFFGQTDGGDLHCDPPQVQHETSQPVGSTTVGVCRGSIGTARIEATYLGREAVGIGGVPTDAVHLRMHATITGRSEGTADEEFWVHPQSGLVLRWERTATAVGDAVFGVKVHYKEHATFLLKSLTPST